MYGALPRLLHAGFGFADAAAIADYLAQLGISHLYPYLQAAPGDDYVVAFTRGERALTVVPRFTLELRGELNDTTIEVPSGRWRNQLTDEANKGGELSVAALLERFPVALLTREEENL